MLLRPDPQSGGDPAKHPARVRPTPGAAQQADTGAAGGAEGGEVPGGAPRGDQQQSAVREDEAGGRNRQLPAADPRHDGRHGKVREERTIR